MSGEVRISRYALALGGLVWVLAATAAAAQTAYTSNYVYDERRRLVMEIQPDPDGAGPLLRPATRRIYDTDGRLTTTETGTATSGAGAGFVALQRTTSTYDLAGKVIRTTTVDVTAGAAVKVNQTSYDALGRTVCSAVRMNMASLPADACVKGTAGGAGPDLITKSEYDAAGQVLKTIRAYGSPLQQDYVTNAYGLNGQVVTAKDARNNLTTMEYDGFDRLVKLRYPTVAGDGVSSTTDYEAYGYDSRGNQVSIRKRNGVTIGYTFDALGRQVLKDMPGSDDDVYTAHDLLGRVKYNHFLNPEGRVSPTDIVRGTDYTYDKAGRALTETAYGKALVYSYDAAGNRTGITWPEAVNPLTVTYRYDALNRVTSIVENGATSGVGVLATYAYDNQNRRATVTRGNGAVTTYSYDPIGRLASLNQNLPGTLNDHLMSFSSYSPADQLLQRAGSNALYKWTAPPRSVSKTYDGLNRDAAIAAVTGGYDASGNLTNDGERQFTYDSENRLLSVAGSASLTLAYDPLGRLRETVAPSPAVTTRFLYDDEALLAEYDGAGTVLRRYVHGPGTDEPVVWYEGAGLTARRWLHQNQQGSIIAQSDATTTATVYAYGPYGEPSSWTGSRFSYTGQTMLGEVRLYYYKARFYDPETGRFLQTDPIGTDDDLNLYAYVGGDPINRADSSGMAAEETCETSGAVTCVASVTVNGCRNPRCMTDEQFVFDQGRRREAREKWPIMAAALAAPVAIIALETAPIWAPWAIRARAGAKPCNCFEAGTLVSTSKGQVAIETVRVGDLVLSRDELTGETAFKPVAALIPGKERHIWDLTVEVRSQDGVARRETVHTTEEHPFRTSDGAWTVARDLRPGASIVTASGDRATVVSVADSTRIEPTYNFEVADFHTYFVGREEIWVHNACNPLWKLGDSASKNLAKMTRQMQQRGWTGRQITEAVKKGEQFAAPNNLNPANGATRYVNPTTGQSVVIDNATRQVIHFGGPGFVY